MKLLSLFVSLGCIATATVAQQCGPGIGSCSGSNCCSQYGWCGVGSIYCDSGCQVGYGQCTPSGSGGLPVSTNGQCGPEAGTRCPTGQCSQYGWCGTSTLHCGTGCQTGHGDCTTTTTTTTTTSTSTPTPTPVTMQVVSQCSAANKVAITFDDGPHIHTSDLLTQLNTAGVKATFFVNGYNYGCIYDYADVLKAAYDSGHQIGAHSWAHGALLHMTNEQIIADTGKLETALRKIIGAVPSYYRAPYGEYDARVLGVLGNLGYEVMAYWSIDSGDSTGQTLQQQKDNYNTSSTSVSHIALNHDTRQMTVDDLVPFILDWITSRGLTAVTLAECLGDTSAYKYYQQRESVDSTWVCTA